MITRRYNSLLCALAVCSLVATSCIKDEAPNAECDIERVTLHVDNPMNLFFAATDTIQSVASADSVILFRVRGTADLSALAPTFRLTDGATVVPASGSVHDFSNGNSVRYRVTSQDGAWSRDYVVRFVPQTVVVADTLRYYFEDYALEPSASKYYLWYDVEDNGSEPQYNWATGNPGFRLSKSSAQPMDYPTIPYTSGLQGSAVQLTTRDTGAFGAMVNMRIAAGNLFIGTFDAAYALRDAMQATCFGLPFTKRPVKLSGYYQFTPGETYKDKAGNAVEGKVDTPDFYGVLYRNHDAEGNAVMLHGDDVLTNPNIVALARIANPQTTTEWTRFDLVFDYYGNTVDEELLKNRGYNLAVVFSSSIDGAVFCGAVGSTLLVDQVELICATEE